MNNYSKLHPYSVIKSLGYELLKRRGGLTYLLFIGYLITIHPGLLRRLAKVSLSNPDSLVGWVFLLIPLLESAGFWLKFPYLSHHARHHPKKPSDGTVVVIVLLPILHVGMSAFLFLVGTSIAGVHPGDDAPWYWHFLYVVGFFLVLIKELGFLAMFLSFAGIEWTAHQRYPPDIILFKRLRKTIREFRIRHLLEDAIGDIFLLVFSSLGYTALWEYMGMSSPFHPRVGFWEYLFQLIGVLVYFMVVIPSLQAVYLLQDTIVRTTKRQKFWSGFQFALTLVAAFLSIARG
jgi:hypothetical protein